MWHKLSRPQMRAPDVGSVYMRYGNLESGFYRFRGDSEGNLFFAGLHGRWVYSFPVLENGEVNRHSDCAPFPNQEIVVLNHDELNKLGIYKVRWSNE